MKLQKGDAITFESGKIVARGLKGSISSYDDVFGIGVNIFLLGELANIMASSAGFEIKYIEEDRAFLVV